MLAVLWSPCRLQTLINYFQGHDLLAVLKQHLHIQGGACGASKLCLGLFLPLPQLCWAAAMVQASGVDTISCCRSGCERCDE